MRRGDIERRFLPLAFVMMGVMLMSVYPWVMLGPLNWDAPKAGVSYVAVTLFVIIGFYLTISAASPVKSRPVLLLIKWFSVVYFLASAGWLLLSTNRVGERLTANQAFFLQEYGVRSPHLILEMVVMAMLVLFLCAARCAGNVGVRG